MGRSSYTPCGILLTGSGTSLLDVYVPWQRILPAMRGRESRVNTYAFFPYDYREPLELGVLDTADLRQLLQMPDD